MKNPGSKRRLGAWLLLSVWLVGPFALLADSEDTTKKVFKMEPGGTLAVDLDRGSIEVTGGDGDAVEVEVWRKASSEQDLKRYELTLAQVDQRVEVKGRWDKKDLSSWWGSRQLQVKCVVKVPRKFNADLRTAGGSITAKTLTGQLDATTSGGSLEFSKIEGPIKGRTSGGHINVAGCVGKVEVGTSGGSLNLSDIQGDLKGTTSGGSVKVAKVDGACDVSTSGGSIRIEDATGKVSGSSSGGSVAAKFSVAPTSDCTLKTSGGGVTVAMPEKSGVELDAATSGGRVTSDLPVEMLVKGEPRRGHLAGKINGGGPKVFLRSSGGSIHVEKN